MLDLVAFDADDTLWENEGRYLRGERMLAEMLAPRVSAEELGRRVLELETRNVPTYGYGVKSFTLSLVEAALLLSEGQLDAADLLSLLEHGRRMLQEPIEIFHGARQVLGELAEEFPLVMITKGDLHEQGMRVERSGLAPIVRRIHIVAEKEPETYRRILETHEVEPSRFVMVGNSKRSDILPVLRLGGHAVFVPCARTWAHEDVDVPPELAQRLVSVERLGQVPAVIRRIASAQERS